MTEKCVGYIQLTFFDTAATAANEIVTLGGAGFIAQNEHDAAWENISEFSGESKFMADRLDHEWSIVDEKFVSAETCERLMSKPITQLIAEGRAKHAKMMFR